MGAVRKLLLAWLKTVKWDHTGGYGLTQARRCPYCFGLSPETASWHQAGVTPPTPESIVHDKDCIVKRTQDYLKRGQGRHVRGSKK